MKKKRFMAYMVVAVVLCGIQAVAGTTDTIGGAAWWTKITDIINDTYIGYLVAAGLTIKGMYEYFGGQVANANTTEVWSWCCRFRLYSSYGSKSFNCTYWLNRMNSRASLYKHIKPSYMICNWDTKEVLIFLSVLGWAIIVRPHIAIIVFVVYVVFESLKTYKNFINSRVPNIFGHFLYWIGLTRFSSYPNSNTKEFIA